MAKNTNQRTILVDIDKIKTAAFNPTHRVERRRLSKLLRSMKTYGQFVPVIITHGFELGDGHRRLECAKILGWKQVAASFTDQPLETLYREINTTGKGLGGNDMLGVWLKNPEAVTERTNRLYAAIEAKIGKKMLRQIYDRGFSSRAYRAAMQTGRYCGDESVEFLRKVISYFLNVTNSRVVEQFMTHGGKPSVLRRAILNGVMIRPTFAPAD